MFFTDILTLSLLVAGIALHLVGIGMNLPDFIQGFHDGFSHGMK